jgi:L-ribulose-5-phosphate 3-epimerase
MNSDKHQSKSSGTSPLGRRELLAYTATLGTTFLATQGLARTPIAAQTSSQADSGASRKRFDMKKSINLWAFPYPQAWPLKKCFEIAKDAGFDGVEVNFALDGDISPDASADDLKRIGDMAREIGIEISGVCSFLFWPFALTSNDVGRRKRGLELAGMMVAAAKALGTENLLVVPGAVYIPWAKQEPPWPPAIEPVANDVCHARATEAIRSLIPAAEEAGVYMNMENIFANGFLFSPEEMNGFVDQFDSPFVKVHFDTGNIMEYQFPEHWVPMLGKRIKNIHLKEFDKANAFNINAFRTLLDGTTDWPAVLEALDKIEYRGYLTFEYFHPFRHYPEALIYQTSDSLDRMLGRKV